MVPSRVPRAAVAAVVADVVVLLAGVLSGCSHSGTTSAVADAGSPGDAATLVDAAPTWSAPLALSGPGPSTEFGNFGKAITTDGQDYTDVVWLQGGATADAGPFIYVGPADITFAQSGDHGATWSTTPLTIGERLTSFPRIASSGSELYVVYPQQDPASGSLQCFVVHGTRTGSQVTWSAPQAISGTPAGGGAVFPVVAATGNAVHVAWTDSRNGGVSEVYYASSQDCGVTWSSPVAISPVDGFDSWTPSIAASPDGRDVYVGWTDARFGKSDCTTNFADCHEVLYLRSSDSGGQSWQKELQLTCDASIYTFAPSLVASNDGIHVAYFQGNPSPPGPMNLYYLKGGVGGAGLTPCAGTKGTRDPITPRYPADDVVLSAWRPDLSVAGGTLHLVWWGELTNDYLTGQAKVYYARSADGVTWAGAESLTPQDATVPYRSFSPNVGVSADGGRVYVIWDDHRDDPDASDPAYRLYFRARSH